MRSLTRLVLTLPASLAVLVSASAALAAGPADPFVDLTKKLDYTNSGTGTSAHNLFRDFGIPTDFNARAALDNPEPEWLPGWASLNPNTAPSAVDAVDTAVAQAIINRTWTSKITADYTRYRAAWVAIEAELAPKLAELAHTDYVTRASGLAAIYLQATQRADAELALYTSGQAPELYRRGLSPASVGFLAEVVAAMVQAHRDAHLEFLLRPYLAANRIELARFAMARPFAEDAIERDTFIAFSQAAGNLETFKLPVMAAEGQAFAAVRWPTSDARDQETAAARATLVQQTAERLALPPAAVPENLLGGALAEVGQTYVLDPSSLGDKFKPLTVAKVAKASGTSGAGAGLDITLETESHNDIPTDCRRQRPTDPVQCFSSITEIKKYSIVVQFADLPAELVPAKGDQLALYADFVSKQESKTSVALVVTGRALKSVTRGNKVIAKFW